MDEFGNVNPDIEAMDLSIGAVATPVSDPVLSPTTLQTEAGLVAAQEGSDAAAEDAYLRYTTSDQNVALTDMNTRTQQARNVENQGFISGLPAALANPNIPESEKAALIALAQKGGSASEDPAELVANANRAAPSSGTEYHDRVRTAPTGRTTADVWNDARTIRSQNQAIMNAANTKYDGQTFSKVVDFFSLIGMPMQDAMVAERLKRGYTGTLSDSLQSVLAPGSSLQDIREHLQTLPPEQHKEALVKLNEILANSSGVLTGGNYFRQIGVLDDLTSEDGGSVFLTNAFNALDAIGLGTAARGAVRTVKGAVRGSRAAVQAGEGAADAASFLERQRGIPAAGIKPAERPAAPPSAPMTAKGAPTAVRDTEAITGLRTKVDAARKQIEDTRLTDEAVKELMAERKDLAGVLKAAPEGKSKKAILAATQAKQEAQARIDEIGAMMKDNQKARKLENDLPKMEANLDKLVATNSNEVAVELNPIMQAVDRAVNQSIMVPYHPRTAGGVAFETNPMLARNMHAQVFYSENEELAGALHGVSRNEALAKAVAPQVTDMTGIVKGVPPDMNRGIREVVSRAFGNMLRQGSGGVEFTPAELARARSMNVNDFTSATGLDLNTAMTSVRHDGTNTIIRGVYTNGETGWLKPEDALEQAQYATKDFAMAPDAFTLMRREGDEYVPVDFNAYKGQEGDYVIGIDANLSAYRVLGRKTGKGFEWDDPVVKRMWLPTKSRAGGSWNRHLFDPSASLDRAIVDGFSYADDQSNVASKFLNSHAANFADLAKKLPAETKKELDAYILEANVKRLPYNEATILERLGPKGKEAYDSWKNFWDIMHDMENRDLVRGLTHQGYEIFKSGDTQLIVKRQPKRYANNTVYDPSTDSVRKLTDEEMTALYDAGGYVGQMRRAESFDGTLTSLVMIRNTPQEYSRVMNDTDKVLTYRDGYFHVAYKSPVFINEKRIDVNGIEYDAVVAIAGGVADAKRQIALMERNEPGRKFSYRGDRNKDDRLGAHFEQAQVEGRMAQRHRGQLFEETVGANGVEQLADLVLSPIESATRAAGSMATRLAMREVTAVAKQRWLDNFGDLTKEVDGIKLFPRTADEIGSAGQLSDRRLKSAHATWEHINYVENGYVNGMDEAYKNAMNYMANALGEGDHQTLEKAMRWMAEVNPTGKVKAGVFYSLLVSNPFRMLLVQMNQAARTFSYSPRGWMTGRIPQWSAEVATAAAIDGKAMSAEGKQLLDILNESGMLWSVSRHNLARETVQAVTDKSLVGGVSGTMAKGVDVVRSAGFDAGERLSLIMHMAAVYEDYKFGRKLNMADPTVRAQMVAEARALTGNMNRAGDMPYNQNIGALVMTYMQIPHKFALQQVSRQLPAQKRLQLLAGDMALWGLPPAAIAGLWSAFDEESGENKYSQLPEPVREVLAEGLQEMITNAVLSEITGQNVDIDISSSLNPLDFGGWNDMFKEGLSGGLMGMLGRTPTAQVFGFDAKSRMGLALHTLGQYFKTDDPTETDLMDVAKSFARFSSGFNNYDKARLMWYTGKARDSMGRLLAEDVSKVEAVAQAFGMPPSRVANRYDVQKDMNDDGAKPADVQAKKDVQTLLRILHSNDGGDTLKMGEFYTRAMMDSTKSWKSMDRATYLKSWYEAVQTDPDQKLTKAFLTNIKKGQEGIPHLVDRAKLAEPYQGMVLQAYKDALAARKMYDNGQK